MPPFFIVDDNEKVVGPILDGDALVTINFQANHMTMVDKAFEYKTFSGFDQV